MKHLPLVLTTSVSGCLHIIFYALLLLWPAPEQELLDKSIPVKLVVTPDSVARIASTSSKSAEQSADKKVITTTKSSEQKTPSSERKKPTNEHNKSSKAQKTVKAAPQQRINQQKQAASIKQIFSRDADTELALPAIQTRALSEMSDYEVELRQHLLEAGLYAPLHRFMRQHKNQVINFELRVILFRNGAIKNAEVTYKDKDIAIEQLVKTVALNASPYPRPPEEDFLKGYTYVVSMTYDPNSDRLTQKKVQ